MSRNSPEFENSILIVAHPDDEVLWFSSLLSVIDTVIIIFRDFHEQPGLGRLRKKAISELPFEVVCLHIPEAGSYGLADWSRAEQSPFGLKLEKIASKLDVSRAYERNFDLIRGRLKTILSPGKNVFTHNPWGEYGHEDHVQVYRIVESLRVELGFRMRVSCYISNRSNTLAQQYVDSGALDPVNCPIDIRKSNEIAKIYKRNCCWTWAENWVWHDSENFLAHPELLLPNDHRQSLTCSPLLRKIPSSV